MKGHPTLPNAKKPQWVRRQPLKAIEKGVSHAPAQHHADRRIENEVIDLVSFQRRIGLGTSQARQPPGKCQTTDVSEAIPVHLDWAQRQRHRIYVWVGQHLHGTPATQENIQTAIAQRLIQRAHDFLRRSQWTQGCH